MSDKELGAILGLSEKELAKLTPEQLERRKELAAATKEAAEENKNRSGVGTRMFAGQTRGKSSLVIKYEQFDDAQPETLPGSVQAFVDYTKAVESDLLKYLIAGYNSEAYTAASDPLAEYVDYSWPTEVQTQFRLVVRNYARGAGVSIDDAVELIKPGFIKQFSAR